MAVYALFNNEAREVLIGLFESGEQRLDFRHINIKDKQVIASAERGFCAIYHILEKGENLSISYEIEGGGEKIIGPSAGLAFALALVGELTDKNLSLAATGDVSNGTKNAKVLPVEFIPEKLTAAIDALSKSEGGIILYPYENDKDVTEELRKDAYEKGIILGPVRTLAEAVEVITQNKGKENSSQNDKNDDDEDEDDKVRRVNPILLVFLSILFAYLGGAFLMQFIETCSMPKETRSLAPIIYPWVEIPLKIKVKPSNREDQIFPAVCQRLVTALQARDWRFNAVISCKSRLLDQTYTYWVAFEKATLETGHGQTTELSLGTCEGSGPSLKAAIDSAIENVWKKLQNLVKRSVQENNATGG